VRREHEPPAAKEHDNKASPPLPPFLADSPLDRALAAMADSYREVIVLHRLLQLPFDDIAVVLGATEAAVKSRAQQGYVQLAEVAQKAAPVLSDNNSQPRPMP
jgi:DNA-directed RNA polymerase specialized sigma24 family protein